jgi:hypothetical protein
MRHDPRLRLYLIADNLSTYKIRIRDWAADANTELVFTPTYASFLNRSSATTGESASSDVIPGRTILADTLSA